VTLVERDGCADCTHDVVAGDILECGPNLGAEGAEGGVSLGPVLKEG